MWPIAATAAQSAAASYTHLAVAPRRLAVGGVKAVLRRRRKTFSSLTLLWLSSKSLWMRMPLLSQAEVQ